MQQEEVARPYELRAQPAKALLQRLYRDVSDLATQEVELAKIEVHERAAVVSSAMRSLAFSAVYGVVGLAALAACVILLLGYVLALWFSALIVGIALLVVAVVTANASKRALLTVTEPLRSKLGALVGPPSGATTTAELESRIEYTRRHLDETLAALEHKTDLAGPVRETALGLGSLGVAVTAIARTSPTP